MKRRLIIVAIFLLFGAVVNVAVAWGIAQSARPQPVQWLFDPDDSQFWSEKQPVAWIGGSMLGVRRHAGFGRTVVDAWGFSSPGVVPPLLGRGESARYGNSARITEDSCGWPMRSLQSTVWWSSVYSGRRGVFELSRSISVPGVPTWPGFAVNTIVYATVLWLLIPGPSVLRRFIRVRRGLCPACAYPRGESDVCSECGKALPGRLAVTT